MLDQIPSETLQQVLRPLKPQDLKRLKLTNKILAAHVTPILFRKISFTILTLDRVYGVVDSPNLSQFVEELSYYELGLSGLSLGHPNNGLQRLANIM